MFDNKAGSMVFDISLLTLTSLPKCQKFVTYNKCIIFNYINLLKVCDYPILKLGSYLVNLRDTEDISYRQTSPP